MTVPALPYEQRDVVVVGTGFGGAVAACRLAQGGLEPLVLERGRRYGRDEFPRDPTDHWFWATHGGPLDVRPLDSMATLQAAGYGGGSLLYSNVHLRMPSGAFADGWPRGWTRRAMDPYYALVEYMLDVTPIDETQPLPVPHRTRRMQEAATVLDRGAQFFRPPLAVTFGPPGERVVNRHGVEQHGCTHCSECNIGCNVGAKNSLDMNYLAIAERCGATMRTGCEVTALAREPDGRYRLEFTDHAAEREHRVVARTVVLAAGALSTTGLLLRSRSYLGLHCDQVGRHYSANGDFLSFGLDTAREFAPGTGPAITAGILHSEGPEPGRPWFLVQDGGVPRRFVTALLHALRTADRARDWTERVLHAVGAHSEADHELERLLREIAAPPESASTVLDDVVVLLGMGRDTADGRVTLRGWPRRGTDITWDVAANAELYATQQSLCDEIVAEGMGGRAAPSPIWHHLRLPVSVHNLGGAVMADDPARGVVDPHGEVVDCPGLFVVDGAALPRSAGVNPSSTIAAVAERNIERLVRALRDEPTWRAPERDVAPRGLDPLPRPPAAGTRPPRRGPVFVRRVSGHGRLVRVGTDAVLPLEFSLVLAGPEAPDPDSGSTTALSVKGELTIVGFGDDRPMSVSCGVVRCTSGDWEWLLPFESGRDGYDLRGPSHAGTVRLSLHAWGPTAQSALAEGTVTLIFSHRRRFR